MHITCKSCGEKIEVSHKPQGGTSVKGINAKGNVNIGEGGISFGRGGLLSFGKGGSISFGKPPTSTFTCFDCGKSHEYIADEIKDD